MVADVFVYHVWEAVFLTIGGVKSQAGNFQMIDWIPVVFVAFKVLIFGACMFFAIKWHYDQGKKEKRN